MKLLIFSFIVVFFIIESVYAQNGECTALKDLTKLSGNWRCRENDKIVFEYWNKASDITYDGASISVSMQKGDTLLNESIRIACLRDEVFYIVKFKPQQMPISFRLIEFTKSKFVFENKENDFPSKLIYEFIGNDKYIVTLSNISGTISEQLEFRRISR